MGASPCSTGGGGDGVYKFLSSVLCLLLYIGRALMGWWWGSGDWTGSLVALGSANRVEHEGSQPHAAGDTGKRPGPRQKKGQ